MWGDLQQGGPGRAGSRASVWGEVTTQHVRELWQEFLLPLSHAPPPPCAMPVTTSISTTSTITSNSATVTEQQSCIMCLKSTPSTPTSTPSPPNNAARLHPGDRPFSCDVCGKGFTQAAHLTRHTRVHTGEKPFSCAVCGKCFSQSGDLTRHARVHTGEKPYSCSVCLKRFSQSGDLSRHTRRAHPGENPFSCAVCLKSFSQSGGLTRHTRVHATSSTSQPTPEPTQSSETNVSCSSTQSAQARQFFPDVMSKNFSPSVP